jgi:hypothetical protein
MRLSAALKREPFLIQVFQFQLFGRKADEVMTVYCVIHAEGLGITLE